MPTETLPATTVEQDELRFISELEKAGGSELMPVADLRKLRLLSESFAKSDLVPVGMRGKPENLMLAMLHARGLGLDPFRAIQNMYVIKGRVSIFGDLFMALVTGFEDYQGHEESFDGDYGDEDYVATCIAHRKGVPTPFRGEFSVADAKRAGLWGKKDSAWANYPKDMLMWKARARAFRQGFAHRLCGVTLYEDIQDVEEQRPPFNITPGRTTVRELEARAEQIEEPVAPQETSPEPVSGANEPEPGPTGPAPVTESEGKSDILPDRAE